jgi:hypothetical protein
MQVEAVSAGPEACQGFTRPVMHWANNNGQEADDAQQQLAADAASAHGAPAPVHRFAPQCARRPQQCCPGRAPRTRVLLRRMVRQPKVQHVTCHQQRPLLRQPRHLHRRQVHRAVLLLLPRRLPGQQHSSQGRPPVGRPGGPGARLAAGPVLQRVPARIEGMHLGMRPTSPISLQPSLLRSEPPPTPHPPHPPAPWLRKSMPVVSLRQAAPTCAAGRWRRPPPWP